MKLSSAALFIATIFPCTIYANETSTTVSIVSEYLNQGFTQSDHNPAIQGEFNWEHEEFHANVWSSTTDYDGVDLEIQWSGGYTFDLNQALSMDLGVMYYSYFGDSEASDINYTEYHVQLAYTDWTFTNYWSFDFSGENATHTILEATYNYTLQYGELEFLADWSYSLDDELINYGNKDNYLHWRVAYKYEAKNDLELVLAYDGTNISKSADPEGLAKDRISVEAHWSF